MAGDIFGFHVWGDIINIKRMEAKDAEGLSTMYRLVAMRKDHLGTNSNAEVKKPWESSWDFWWSTWGSKQ